MTISISDLVQQNTLGQSEAFPLGVPQSWNWYKGWISDGLLAAPPANFTAVEGWGVNLSGGTDILRMQMQTSKSPT